MQKDMVHKGETGSGNLHTRQVASGKMSIINIFNYNMFTVIGDEDTVLSLTSHGP